MSTLLVPETPKLPEISYLSFITSPMRGGKSGIMHINYYNDNAFGKKPIIIKPNIDTREETFQNEWGLTKSRAFPDQTLRAFYTEKIDHDLINKIIIPGKFNRIHIEEAQFFTPSDIEKLTQIVHNMNIPVKCYGLKADVNGNLFPGSAKLLAITRNVFEIPYNCEMQCGDWASVHLRFVDRQLDLGGKSVAIEQGDTAYLSVCPKCWQKIVQGELKPKFR